METKHVIVLSSWIVIIFLLLLILPVNELSKLMSVFDFDALGTIFFITVIFALGLIFLASKDEDTRDRAAVKYDVSQLRSEVETLHAKIDEIKRLMEF